MDTIRIVQEPDYFPIQNGLSLKYQYTSTRFKGIELVDIKIVALQRFLNDVLADAAVTRTRMGQSNTTNYRITRTRREVRSEGGVLGFSRLEFPLPPVPGKQWLEEPDRHEIASLDAALQVPAGRFQRCLRVNTYIAGGDGGSAIRYYAPGIGYIYEEYSDETWGARVELLAYEFPRLGAT